MIYTIAHQKGGTGKSTIAVNLAVSLSADLLDLDKQHSSIIFNCNRKNAGYPAIACFSVQESGCLFDGQQPIQQEKIPKLLASYANRVTPVLVIDCGGFDSQMNRGALYYADRIITPLAPSGAEIYGLQMFETILAEVERKTESTLLAHVLINSADLRSKRRIEELQQFVRQRPHFQLLHTIIGQRIAYKISYEEGLSVEEMYQKALRSKEKQKFMHAAEEIQALVREVQQLEN